MTTQTTIQSTQAVPSRQINVEKLIESSLPSSTNSLMKLRSKLRDVNASNSAISNAIIYQPLLVARILRLANSATYSANKTVSSIPMAINVVGTKVLSDIVTLEITSSAFKKVIQNSALAKKVWEHSLAVGVIARRLSEVLKMTATEEVFTCGLLHDLGKMLLLTEGDKAYESIIDSSTEEESLSREKTIYGYNHTELGALITHRWGLPENICYTILHHHDSSQAVQYSEMIYLIDIANMTANAKGYGIRQSAVTEDWWGAVCGSQSAFFLGLTKEVFDRVCTESLDQSIQEIISTFA